MPTIPSRSLNAWRSLRKILNNRPVYFLAACAVLSFLLNAVGLGWGLPEKFHPDETIIQTRNFHIFSGRLDEGVYFGYGNLSQIAHLLFVWPALFFDGDKVTAAIFLARLSSALLGALLPILLGRSAWILFGEPAGKMTALLGALCPGIINYSHFGTPDIFQLAGIAAGFWCAVYLLNHSGRRRLFLCGFVIGLTTAIKYQGWIMIAPVFLAVFWRARDEKKAYFEILKRLLFILAGAAGGFLAGMPWIWIDLPFVMTWWLNVIFVIPAPRGLIGPPAWIQHLKNVHAIAGPIILTLILISFLKAIRAVSKGSRPELLLLAPVVFFYLVTGSFRFVPVHYSLALIAPLLILSGNELARWPAKWRAAGFFAIGLFTLWFDMGFIYDSRLRAYRWMTEHIPRNSKIETPPIYGPKIPPGSYVWRGGGLPREPMTMKDIPAPLTGFIGRFFSGVIKKAEREKISPPNEPLAREFTKEALNLRQTDFVILSDRYVKRYRYPLFAKANPLRARYYLDFWDEKMPGYVLASRFKFFPQRWWAPQAEFVDPEIRIYARSPGT